MKQNHTEKCRERVYQNMMAAGDKRFLAAEAQDKDRTRTKLSEPNPSPQSQAKPEQPASIGAEVPVPETPTGPPVGPHVQEPDQDAEPSPSPAPRTPRPSWADLSDEQLFKGTSSPHVVADEQPAEDDLDDAMTSDNFYVEVNEDAEMLENAQAMVGSLQAQEYIELLDALQTVGVEPVKAVQ